jgi:LysR family transcriptional activator of mexEF-oprN operon
MLRPVTALGASFARDLDLNLLRVFVVVVEEGSVTRAASRLYVTQPAVSASMRRLASFIGAELFSAARRHIEPLLAATTAGPAFDPTSSTATVKIGLADSVEAILLPPLLALLRAEAPKMRLIVQPVQFRTVEDALLASRVDLAITVADELPRSIVRQPLFPGDSDGFVCLHDSRCLRLPHPFTEEAYFACEHVVVSYAGDARGIVEDTLGKARQVRVSIPSFLTLGDVIDGSPLLATVPRMLAWHLIRTRPHLQVAELPFPLDKTSLDLLWCRATDEDPVLRFVRDLVLRLPAALSARRS